MRLAKLSDNHRQFYAHDCVCRIGQFPHQDVLGKHIYNHEEIHFFSVEHISCQGVP